MTDHEPLDPNVPHPDIPQIEVHQGSICDLGGVLFLAGFSAGYDHAQQELLPHDTAHQQTHAAMETLTDDEQFLEEVHDAVHQVIARYGHEALIRHLGDGLAGDGR